MIIVYGYSLFKLFYETYYNIGNLKYKYIYLNS